MDISTEIQKQPGRAEYGAQMLERLAETLILEYGPGYSRANLQDMRRFADGFEIRQTLSGEFGTLKIFQALSRESDGRKIRQPLADKLSEKKDLEERLRMYSKLLSSEPHGTYGAVADRGGGELGMSDSASTSVNRMRADVHAHHHLAIKVKHRTYVRLDPNRIDGAPKLYR